MTGLARHAETAMWVLAAFLIAHYIYDTAAAERRALNALDRDGYTGAIVLGRGCTVTQATDKSGEQVQAWACPWVSP